MYKNIKISVKKIVIILIASVLFGVVAGAFFALIKDLPQIRCLETFKPSAVTRIYSLEKNLLAELFVENRNVVPLEVIPDHLKTALLATEDRNFYKHCGIDVKGIFRAVISNISAGGFVEGASTITQQLAKTLFLTRKKTLMRKFKEAFLSFQLERRYTKDEILQIYLNQIYFGSGAYGVESAAKIFFGKSAKDLNLAECAMIAAMPKAPSRYSPLVNAPLAIKRRNIVLKQMLTTGIINKTQYKQSANESFETNGHDSQFNSEATWFVEYVKKFLENILGSSKLYKGGLTIFTTLSFELQTAADLAVANGISALTARMEQNGIKNPYPQGALIALDVQSGGILVMTGGVNFQKNSFNRAVSAMRQPGSAFKPIVYACAVEKGISQNMSLLDSPIAFKGLNYGEDWAPENFSEGYEGEITLRKALSFSKNIPAVRLIEMIGASSVAKFGRTLGIKSHLAPVLSLALGSSEVSLIDLTAAYAVFPNMGNSIKPFGVMEVLDCNGRIIWRAKPKKKAVMSRCGAAIMTDMLQGVIKEGTGRKAQVIKASIAGKTGTTNNFKDALFIGFSPSIATGVWVGQDNAVSLGQWETGSRAALPIWIEFMTKALENKSYQYFDIPDDVVKVCMNSVTGHLAHPDLPNAVTALFKKGTEPCQ